MIVILLTKKDLIKRIFKVIGISFFIFVTMTYLIVYKESSNIKDEIKQEISQDKNEESNNLRLKEKNVYIDKYRIVVNYDSIKNGLDFEFVLGGSNKDGSSLNQKLEEENFEMMSGINTVIDYVMYFFVITLYVSLLFYIMYKITTKYLPYLMKYVKKGLSKKESTRVTGFRSIIRYRMKGFLPLIITMLFVIYLTYDLYNSKNLECFVVGTLYYVAGYVLYVLMIMVYEYLLIQRELRNF